jgi:hypothetical protein
MRLYADIFTGNFFNLLDILTPNGLNIQLYRRKPRSMWSLNPIIVSQERLGNFIQGHFIG